MNEHLVPYPVDPPPRPTVMVHRWEMLTFLHWRYDPAEVQRLLPEGLTVETYDGAAWVGLVPFHMVVRVPGIPPLPWASYFPETNVRTYVTGPDGKTGVWFFSLDASRAGAVAVARTTMNLPYCWAGMRVGRRGDVVRYVSRRRWPDRAHNEVEIEVGEPIGEASELENYLTARFRLWTVIGGVPMRAQAHHPPWQLNRATVRRLDTGLLTAASLTHPAGDPLVHYSDGVTVRIGLPRR